MTQPEDIICPTSREICPALSNLAELYVGNENSVEPDQASEDRKKFTWKKREYLAAAALVGCEGVTVANTCPIRDKMDESKVRKTGVGVFRAFRTALQKNSTI